MKDDQLIFMISMPRSGSTMLQKIVGSHSLVYTRSEPWLMLHPLHALKSSDIQTRFNAKLAEDGVRDFISGLPKDGLNYYYKQIQSCYLGLYNQYLENNDKTRFLDKTPRYYEIFDELQLTFPQAKYIIIYRNPLAILSSLLETWIKGNYKNLIGYKADLEQGPEFLLRDFSQYKNTHLVRYENILKQPINTTRKLFTFLQLDFEPGCINYGRNPTEKWLYGDPQTVYRKSAPDITHIDAWQAHLKNPATFKLISDYLEKLGEVNFNMLGYDYTEAKQVLDAAHQNFSHPKIITASLAENMLNNAEKMTKTIGQLIKERAKNTEVINDKDLKIETQSDALKQLTQVTHDKDLKIETQSDALKQLTQVTHDKDLMIATQSEALKELEIQHESKRSDLDAISPLEPAFMDLISVSGFRHPFKKAKRYKRLLAIHRKTYWHK